MHRAAAWLLLLLPACGHALAPLLADAMQDDTQVAAVPTGDGAQYVSVITEERASATGLRNRWRREAARTCDGDYLVLSETSSQRRSAGLVASSTHEGFVRCVSPEATLRDEDKPVSDGGRTGGVARGR